MKGRLSGQTGMSLVEATIILMVLAVLTAVLAPSISGYVDDARQVKAKEDVEAIGTAVMRLLKDTGSKFLLTDGDAAFSSRHAIANRVDLLVSDGDRPTNVATVTGPATNAANIESSGVGLSWSTLAGTANTESMYDHLVANNPGYEAPADDFDSADPGAPVSKGEWGFGWRGAYLGGVVGPDAWGRRYACNTVYLGAGTDASTDGEGKRGRGWSFDTICVSAGPDARIEVNFEDTITASVGGGTSLDDGTVNDDILYVISGYGR